MNNLFLYYFHNKFADDAYKYFGAHFQDDYTVFRVYAPHATEVSVVGDFNNWDITKNKMQHVDDGGIFEIKIPDIKVYIILKSKENFSTKIPIMKEKKNEYKLIETATAEEL